MKVIRSARRIDDHRRTKGRPTGCGVEEKTDGGEGGIVELKFDEGDYWCIEKGREGNGLMGY